MPKWRIYLVLQSSWSWWWWIWIPQSKLDLVHNPTMSKWSKNLVPLQSIHSICPSLRTCSVFIRIIGIDWVTFNVKWFDRISGHSRFQFEVGKIAESTNAKLNVFQMCWMKFSNVFFISHIPDNVPIGCIFVWGTEVYNNVWLGQ